MKPETKNLIRRLLLDEVSNKRCVMMRYIEGWHNQLDEVIKAYREAHSALVDFDRSMEDEEDEEDEED